MKKKRSLALLFSTVLGGLYGLYLVSSFSGAIFGAQSDAAAVGGMIAAAMVTPHMLCVLVGAILNLFAYLGNRRGLALTSAILYCAAAVFFLLYIMFLIPTIILAFVGYARLGKINAENAAANL